LKIISKNIAPDLIEKVKLMAKIAEIGGKSHVRPDRNERIEMLSEDQMTSQICEAAFYVYLHGHSMEWVRNRWFKNHAPYIGDNGSDVPPSNIDVKGSLRRYPNIKPEEYHLLVRPPEFRQNTVYIFALAEPGYTKVHFIGWATSDMFPKELSTDRRFAGAHVLPASSLNPLPPITWNWVE
jgi:hypothetical protein